MSPLLHCTVAWSVGETRLDVRMGTSTSDKRVADVRLYETGTSGGSYHKSRCSCKSLYRGNENQFHPVRQQNGCNIGSIGLGLVRGVPD